MRRKENITSDQTRNQHLNKNLIYQHNALNPYISHHSFLFGTCPLRVKIVVSSFYIIYFLTACSAVFSCIQNNMYIVVVYINFIVREIYASLFIFSFPVMCLWAKFAFSKYISCSEKFFDCLFPSMHPCNGQFSLSANLDFSYLI